MRVEIDQSGRVENTSSVTVIAFSNGLSGTVEILATDKRRCIDELRQRGLTGTTLYYKIFAGLVFLVLRPALGKVAEVIIDTEYQGSNAQGYVRQLLREYMKRFESQHEQPALAFQ